MGINFIDRIIRRRTRKIFWTEMSSLITGIEFFGTASFPARNIYFACSGWFPFAVTRHNQEYNIIGDFWTLRADTIEGYMNHGVGTGHADFYHVCGRHGTVAGAPPGNINHRYDLTVNFWNIMAVVPTPRRQSGVAGLNGLLYCMGGDTGPEGGAFTPTAANEEYNHSLNSWTIKAPVPTARSQPGMALNTNLIYCAGASTVAENNRYNPSLNTWENLAHLPVAASRTFLADIGSNILHYITNLSNHFHYFIADNLFFTRPSPPHRFDRGAISSSISQFFYCGGDVNFRGVVGRGNRMHSRFRI